MTGSLPLKDRQRGSNPVQRAAQIDVDHRIPIVDSQRIEAGNGADPSIVHQDVQLAAALEASATSASRSARRVTSVTRYATTPPSERNVMGDGCQSVLSAGTQHHDGAALREQPGGRTTDSAARSGDCDDLARDAHVCSLSIHCVATIRAARRPRRPGSRQ